MNQSTLFSNYLKNHQAEKGGEITHTRIGDKDSGIFGGAYYIPDEEYEEFMKLYYKNTFCNGKLEYLTEKQLIENGPIMIDVDFRYKKDINKRQHTLNHIMDLVMLYADKIEEMVILNDDVKVDVFVMHKGDVNKIEDKTKDGIHIIIGIKMHKAQQVLLRKNVIDEIQNMWEDLPITNSWDDVFDDGITKGCVNWQVYGSRKPNHQAYLLTTHYELSRCDGSWEILEKRIEDLSIEKNILKLSARYTHHPEFQLKEELIDEIENIKKTLNKKKLPKALEDSDCDSGYNSSSEDNKQKTIESDEYLDLLFNYLGNEEKNGKKTISYQDRLCIRFILKSNKYDKKHYIDYCNLREGKGKDKADEDWDKLNITEITPTYVLEGLAKRLVPLKYKQWLKKRDDKIKVIGKELLLKVANKKEIEEFNKCIIDDLDGCDSMKKKYGESIVKCGDTWYANMPDTNYWSRGEEYVKELVMTSRFTKRVGENEKPYSSNATGCNNIFKAMEISSKNFPLNINFINDINRQTKGKLYFQDKYWDFIKKDWFPIRSDNIPLIYIKRNAPTFNFTEEEINDFKKCVLNMFANDNDSDLYLQAMSRALAGYIEDKKFYVLKGLRNSGKGILQEQAFASHGEYCCIYDVPMSKSNHKADASDRRWVLTTQAHIKRVGFTNEVAGIAGKVELTIDGNEIKKVIASGGDTFQARGHYADELDVKFNATTFMCLNNIPTSTPADGLENMILFDMPFKFVEKSMVEEDTILYREKDSKLKEKIQTNTKWRDIYLHLLFNSFNDEPVEFSKMNEDSKAEMIKSTGGSDSSNPVKLFNNAFIKNENGWVSTTDIKKVLEPAKLNDVKFSKFLKDRGFIQKRGESIPKLNDYGQEVMDENGKVKKHSPYGYKGLSFKNNDEDDE